MMQIMLSESSMLTKKVSPPDLIYSSVRTSILGHMVASHTWAHKDLTTLTWDQIHDEMWRVEQALQRIVGVTPAFMRPPYGNYNDLVRQASYVRGQKLVTWDFDSGDSTGSTAAQSNAAYDTRLVKNPSTLLALNHEVYGALSSISTPNVSLISISMPPFKSKRHMSLSPMLLLPSKPKVINSSLLLSV